MWRPAAGDELAGRVARVEPIHGAVIHGEEGPLAAQRIEEAVEAGVALDPHHQAG